jgi:bacterioferritin
MGFRVLHVHPQIEEASMPIEAPMAIDSKAVVAQLNKLLEMELSGVTRYLHYSFMVFGANRIPIVAWFRDQVNEGVAHSVLVGEKITAYNGEPSVAVRPVPTTRHQSLRAMLEESSVFERESLAEYVNLLGMAEDDIALEEFARAQILAETTHLEEVDKMLRGMPKDR